MEKYDIKGKNIKPHNIIFATTKEDFCNSERLILLEHMPHLSYGEFVLLEGSHCSCYDFDDTEWEATKLTKEELKKILSDDQYNMFTPLRKELKKAILDNNII